MADDEDVNEDVEEDALPASDDDGGEEGSDEEGSDEDSKKGSSKKLLMILVPLILLGGGGAAAYFMGMLDPLLGVEAAAEDEHGESEHAEDDGHGEKKKDTHAKKDDSHGGGDGHGEEGGASSAFLAIPTMIVNLNTEDGTPRYLRLTVQLELEDSSERAEVEAIIPRVIDQFQTYLRELRVRDLRGSAGIYRLQMELLWRVNQAADPVEIKDVLFQEILIQ